MDWLVQHAPMIGLLIFVVFFAAVAVWVYAPGSSDKFKKYSNIPFDEDHEEARDE